MRVTHFYLSFAAVLVILFLVVLFAEKSHAPSVEETGENDAVTACTLEALMCPDGSFVGRSGEACAFAACPQRSPLRGELLQDGDGFKLVLPAPEGAPTDPTYVLPLTLKVSNVTRQMVGKQVTIEGRFTEGNTYEVSLMEPSEAHNVEGGGVTDTLAIGDSALIGRVKVTVEDVVGDNRCPQDVVCAVAGEAIVKVTLQSDTDTETAEISSARGPHAFDSFNISITEVLPIPISTKVIEKDEYRITFLVQPLE